MIMSFYLQLCNIISDQDTIIVFFNSVMEYTGIASVLFFNTHAIELETKNDMTKNLVLKY